MQPRFLVDETYLSQRKNAITLDLPNIKLHCKNSDCGGMMIFACRQEVTVSDTGRIDRFIYTCNNCRTSYKVYCLYLQCSSQNGAVQAYKIGESPSFGPPTPRRVLRGLGDYKDLFLKGRQAENQGLGVGAFAYYRQVLEKQWEELLESIIKVAEKTHETPTMIETLRSAKSKRQFSSAVETVKDAIPSSLLIDGHHNPLKLLHAPLSEGIHGKTDAECLDIAHHIRVVLIHFSERLSDALANQDELNESVKALLDKKADK